MRRRIRPDGCQALGGGVVDRCLLILEHRGEEMRLHGEDRKGDRRESRQGREGQEPG